MNVELMERVITRILSDEGYDGGRERFYMGDWIEPRYLDDDATKIDVCGTSCCLAGEAVLLDLIDSGVSQGAALKRMDQWDREWETPIPLRAAGALGLTGVSSPRVFFREDWPRHYGDLVRDSADPDGPLYNGEAVAAAALLRDMIDGRVVLDPDDHDQRYWQAFTGNAAPGVVKR